MSRNNYILDLNRHGKPQEAYHALSFLHLVLFASALALFFCGCEDPENTYLINTCKPDVTTSISFVMTDSFLIDQPIEHTGPYDFYDYFSNEGTEYIIRSGNKNVILVFNLTSRRLEKVIRPDQHQATADRIRSVYVHNLDSIFYTDLYTSMGYLINGEGQLLKQWNLGTAMSLWNSVQPYSVYSSPRRMFYDYPDLHVSMDHGTISDYGRKDRGNLAAHAVFDTQAKSWKMAYGHFPGYYLHDEKAFFVDELNKPTKLVEKERVLVSYPLSHAIQVYDKNGQLVEDICASSSYIDTLEQPVAEIRDEQQLLILFNSSPAYLNLAYHAELNIYSRLVRRKYDIINEDGSMKSPLGIQYTMILLDENLRRIAEKPLDGYLYDWRFALATPDGYIVSPIGEKWAGKEKLMFTDKYRLRLK